LFSRPFVQHDLPIFQAQSNQITVGKMMMSKSKSDSTDIIAIIILRNWYLPIIDQAGSEINSSNGVAEGQRSQDGNYRGFSFAAFPNDSLSDACR
jgi:hypothetical protein